MTSSEKKTTKHNQCICNYLQISQGSEYTFSPLGFNHLCWSWALVQHSCITSVQTAVSRVGLPVPMLRTYIWAQALTLGCRMSYSSTMPVPGHVPWPRHLTSRLAFARLDLLSHHRLAWGSLQWGDPGYRHWTWSWLTDLTSQLAQGLSLSLCFAWCSGLSSDSG